MPTERERIQDFLNANPDWKEFLSERAKAGKLMNPEDVKPEDPLTIVASRNHERINGAVQAKCECGTIVWLSPSTEAMRKAREPFPTRIVCISCFANAVKGDL